MSERPGKSDAQGKEEAKEGGSQFVRSALDGMFSHIGRGTGGDEASDDDPGRQPGTLKRQARGILRRRVRLSLPDIYLQLGAALAERRRFEEATEAFQHALREGGSPEDVLEDFGHSAESAGERDLALRARLELSLLRPERSGELTARASRLFDEDVAAAQGQWVLDEWHPRIEQQELSAAARFEVALLAGRAGLYQDNDEMTFALFADAAKADPDRARLAAGKVLEATSLPPRWQADDKQGHWLKARAYAALGVGEKAVEEADAALAAATPGEDLNFEVALLDLKVGLLVAAGRAAEAAAALVHLGRRHDMQIEHGLAVDAYARATELDPANAEAWWYLGDSRRLVAAGLEAGGAPFGNEVRQARDELHAGLALTAPSADEAWVYWAAALLAEGTSTASDDPDELLFEAALCAEHAVVLNPSLPGPCALLVRYYRMLRKPATAIVALADALQTDPGDEDVLRERFFALAELGFASALDALDDYERRVPGGPTAGVRGFVLLHAGRYDEAEAAFSAAIDQEPDDAGVRIHRVLARALAGDVDGAREDASRVLELTAPGGGETDGHSRGWAALVTRDLDEARALFDAELETASADPVEVRLGLACAEQLAGDTARASALLAEAADLAMYPRHVAIGRLTLELARRLDAPVAWQADPGLFEAAAERVAGRAFDGDEALDELEAVVGTSAEGEPRWVAAVAARARVLALQRRWSEAADAYEALLARSSQSQPSPLTEFAPARFRLVSTLAEETEEAVATGDVQRVERTQRKLVELGEISESMLPLTVARAHRAAGRLDEALRALEPLRLAEEGPGEMAVAWLVSGDLLLTLERPDEATRAYERALDLTDKTALEARARLQARLGVAAAAADDTARAVDLMRGALETVRPREGRTKAAQTVIAACADVVSFADTPLLFPATLRKLLEHEEETRGQRRRLASARFEVLRAGGEAEGTVDTISPLVLEADERLFPAGAETEGVPELIEEAIPAMRNRIRRDTGVLIPGVLIQTNPLLHEEFRVHLHGVPYGRDHVPEGAILCTDAGAARERGLDGEPLPNAWLGNKAAMWLEKFDANEAAIAGLPLLGVLDAMLWSLEGLVRVHLHRLVGLAEIDYMVEEWRLADEPSRSKLVGTALPNQRARIQFAAVVRALVRERISVDDLGAVLDAFAAAADAGADSVAEAVEAARLALPEAPAQTQASQPAEALA